MFPTSGFPEGTNIVFTDSMPLLALLTKASYQATGHWLNYFGFWLFACFPLLAAFAALSMRVLHIEDPVAMLAAAFLAVSFPALLVRFGHASLMGHFLIVWALYLYLRMRNEPSPGWPIAQFALIAAASVLLQAYFLPMVLLFLLAGLIHAVVERRVSMAYAAAGLGIAVAATLTAGWIGGVVGWPGVSPGGFGHFSMNAVSPFLPPRDHLPESLARHVHWDGNGYTWDATGGQYEGYNYLGAGMLLLLVVGFALAPRLVLDGLKRHAALALFMALLVVIALSNRVFIGDWLILDVRIPRLLAGFSENFRTGGRFFWPVITRS